MQGNKLARTLLEINKKGAKNRAKIHKGRINEGGIFAVL